MDGRGLKDCEDKLVSKETKAHAERLGLREALGLLEHRVLTERPAGMALVTTAPVSLFLLVVLRRLVPVRAKGLRATQALKASKGCLDLKGLPASPSQARKARLGLMGHRGLRVFPAMSATRL
jgi:hypothetical protein